MHWKRHCNNTCLIPDASPKLVAVLIEALWVKQALGKGLAHRAS